jgi:predicted alpha/beta-hydrolase family hydrolase
MSVVSFESPDVQGFLHQPEDGRSGAGLLLAHGAGSNCNAPLLFVVVAAFFEVGVTVLRCNLPFRRRRASGPPSPATASAD